MVKPWIVYTRCAGVLKLVSRFANEERALAKAQKERCFCKHVDDMDLSARRALGLKEAQVDVQYRNHGSVVGITPVSQSAKEWVKDNVHIEDWQRQGSEFLSDARMGFRLLEAMKGEGFSIAT